MGIIPGMGVTRNEFLDAYEYDGQYYENYEDIPFATKKAYETVVPAVSNFAKRAWQNELDQPITGHVLKGAVWAATKTFQYIDKESMGSISGALGLLDKGMTKAADAVEYHTGLYSPTAKLGTELAVDYLATGGGGKALKTAKVVVNKGDNVATTLAKKVFPEQQFAYETVLTNDSLFRDAVNTAVNTPDFKPNTVFAAISAQGKASKTFKEWDAAARKYAEPRLEAGEKYPLAGFNKKFVDPTNGQIYTVGTYTSSKTGITKYVYKNQEGKAIATLNRNAARKLDEDTLRFQFSKYQNKYPDVDLVESYRKTNRKVYRSIEEELRELNAEGIEKFGKEWKELQVEHIHDVQHFGKLGTEAKRFKNKGADELWNLTIIPSDVNARTGAAAMKVNPADALITATKNDTFIPYEQVTREFIDFDLADKVQKMTKADFTALTQMILKNPGENVHQLLSNYSLIN